MKLIKFLAGVALAATLASCSGKNEDKPTPKTPGALKSLALLASDNSDLTEDIVVSDISSSSPMIVRIDGGGKGKTLVATVSAGEDDVITDGAGNVITEGKISFDASYSLDIIVTNKESKLSTAYELKVGKILKTVVTKLASYAEENAEYGMTQYFNMAINPADGLPYIVYLRRLTIDGKQESNNLASVAKWNSTTNKFELVGESGFPSNAAKAVSSPVYIGFDKNNTPEVIYGGGEVANTFSAKKLTGGSWQNLGSSGFGEKYTASLGVSELYKNPVTGELGFFMTNNLKNDAYYRCHFNCEFDGAEWVVKHEALPGILKANGTADVFYCASGANTASAAYVITSVNGHGYSVYKNTDGSNWSLVVDNFVPEGETLGVPSPSLRLDKDGNLYALVSRYTNGTMQVYKLDEANATLVPYGNMLSAVYTEGPQLTINPVTNEFIAVKLHNIGTSSNPVYQPQWASLDAETKQWSDFSAIVVDGSARSFQLAYNASGEVYLAYYLQTPVEGVGTATSIELCKIGIEDDILPE